MSVSKIRLIAAVLAVAVISLAVAIPLVAKPRQDDVWAGTGLALAAIGMGAELAIALAYRARRRRRPRLAPGLAISATLIGGAFAAAAVGAEASTLAWVGLAVASVGVAFTLPGLLQKQEVGQDGLADWIAYGPAEWVAVGATFLGGLLTVGATGLDVQGDAGDGWTFVALVVGLALMLILVAGALAWHVSSAVPPKEASGKLGRHVASEY